MSRGEPTIAFTSTHAADLSDKAKKVYAKKIKTLHAKNVITLEEPSDVFGQVFMNDSRDDIKRNDRDALMYLEDPTPLEDQIRYALRDHVGSRHYMMSRAHANTLLKCLRNKKYVDLITPPRTDKVYRALYLGEKTLVKILELDNTKSLIKNSVVSVNKKFVITSKNKRKVNVSWTDDWCTAVDLLTDGNLLPDSDMLLKQAYYVWCVANTSENDNLISLENLYKADHTIGSFNNEREVLALGPVMCNQLIYEPAY